MAWFEGRRPLGAVVHSSREVVNRLNCCNVLSHDDNTINRRGYYYYYYYLLYVGVSLLAGIGAEDSAVVAAHVRLSLRSEHFPVRVDDKR